MERINKQNSKLYEDKIYGLFADIFDKKEIDNLIANISLFNSSPDSKINDLFFCYFIKKGLNKKHIKALHDFLKRERYYNRLYALPARINDLITILKNNNVNLKGY